MWKASKINWINIYLQTTISARETDCRRPGESSPHSASRLPSFTLSHCICAGFLPALCLGVHRYQSSSPRSCNYLMKCSQPGWMLNYYRHTLLQSSQPISKTTVLMLLQPSCADRETEIQRSRGSCPSWGEKTMWIQTWLMTKPTLLTTKQQSGSYSGFSFFPWPNMVLCPEVMPNKYLSDK